MYLITATGGERKSTEQTNFSLCSSNEFACSRYLATADREHINVRGGGGSGEIASGKTSSIST